MCLLCTTDCLVFYVKTKIYVLVPSDIIKQPKSTDFNIKRFGFLVFSVARIRFDDITKNQSSNTWISLLNMQILNFPLCQVKGVRRITGTHK